LEVLVWDRDIITMKTINKIAPIRKIGIFLFIKFIV
jgi:hypothetical protein